MNALCSYPKPINNLSVCDDTAVVAAAVSEERHYIDVGAAGTAMRFLTAYYCCRRDCLITGSERMKKRPVRILVDALNALGAKIVYVGEEGCPPVHMVRRTLKGGEIELDGSVSSQFVSAILMVAPMMTNGLRLHLTGQISSKPYINITVQLMRQFGITVFEEENTFLIPPQQHYSSPDNYTVEADWSAASYWYETIALCKDKEASVSLVGLRQDSLQGDASIAALFDKLGVHTTFTSSGVILTKKQPTIDKPLFFDFTSMPDMAQTVAVTCSMLQIPFHFEGLHTLRIKETDRIHALKTELQKLGRRLEIRNENSLTWNGAECQVDALPVIDTYKDHRMAMAFAPVACCLEKGVCIADPNVVSKSYPTFWDDLKKANFLLTDF
jgi:3-phosphoshikimate 1-carboxyvinyltransferase